MSCGTCGIQASNTLQDETGVPAGAPTTTRARCPHCKAFIAQEGASCNNPRCPPKQLDPALTSLADLVCHPDVEMRANAVEALGQRYPGDDRPLPALSVALQDETVEVRICACAALGHIGTPAALALLRQAATDPEATVRYATCQAMSRCAPTTEGLDTYAALLQDPDFSVRYGSVRALEQYGYAMPEAIALLQAVTQQDRPGPLTAEAEAALYRLTAPVADLAQDALHGSTAAQQVSALYALDRRNPGPDTLAVQAQVLATWDADFTVKMQALAGLTHSGGEQAVSAIAPALRDRQRAVRAAALTALTSIGGETAGRSILRALAPDLDIQDQARAALRTLHQRGAPILALLTTATQDFSDYRQCRWAVDAWPQFGFDLARPALQPLLHAADTDLRATALRALAQTGGHRAIPLLTEALGDPAQYVRWQSVELLDAIPDAQATTALITALQDEAPRIRETALQALAHRPGAHAACEPVRQVLATDQELFVRVAALDALAAVGTTQAIPPLVSLLQDPEAQLRYGAAQALGHIGTPAVVAPLQAALHDDNQAVRSIATRSLALAQGPAAIPTVVTMFADDDPVVRLAAAEALGTLGDAAAIPALRQRLQDDDPPVVEATITALTRIGGAEAVAALMPLVNPADTSAPGFADSWRVQEAIATIRGRTPDKEQQRP